MLVPQYLRLCYHSILCSVLFAEWLQIKSFDSEIYSLWNCVNLIIELQDGLGVNVLHRNKDIQMHNVILTLTHLIPGINCTFSTVEFCSYRHIWIVVWCPFIFNVVARFQTILFVWLRDHGLIYSHSERYVVLIYLKILCIYDLYFLCWADWCEKIHTTQRVMFGVLQLNILTSYVSFLQSYRSDAYLLQSNSLMTVQSFHCLTQLISYINLHYYKHCVEWLVFRYIYTLNYMCEFILRIWKGLLWEMQVQRNTPSWYYSLIYRTLLSCSHIYVQVNHLHYKSKSSLWNATSLIRQSDNFSHQFPVFIHWHWIYSCFLLLWFPFMTFVLIFNPWFTEFLVIWFN